MRFITVSAAVFLMLFRSGEGADSVAVFDSSIDSALECLITQQYDAAVKVLATPRKSTLPDLRRLYLAFAVEQTRILDYESYIVEQQQFQRYADSLRPVFENTLSRLSGSDSTEGLFYLANIYGGIGVMQAKTGKIFKGVKNAVTSVSLLREVKERDSMFIAADLGIGVFDYYLSTSFKWLPFIEDREVEGLKAVRRAVDAGFPYNYAARNSLCWILVERKEFRQADSIAQIVLDAYPDNSIFLRIRALIALWTGKYDLAIRLGKQLISVSEKRVPQNWSDLVAGYRVLVESYSESGRQSEACGAASKVHDYPVPQSYLDFPHVKKNLKKINSVSRKCSKGKN